MSELKVNILESNNTLTANSLTVGNVTVNSIGITAPGYVVNTSTINLGDSSANISITVNSSVNFVVVNNATNVFPNPLDIYAWASSATLNNCLISRDTTIPVSPAGGIPFKITPTGSDPHPSTYRSNTWNIAPTVNNDIWKVSGYVRANGDVTIPESNFLLPLPANSIGEYSTAGVANGSPSVTLTGNTWTYFEKIFQINGTAQTRYIQIRPDGEQTGTYDFWYDGLSLQKVVSNTTPFETVNTQIFTANGVWTKPSWATDGKELVIVHAWGGGGGGASNNTASCGGGGGAFVYGYFTASQCNATCNVVVGLGGTTGAGGSPIIDGTSGGTSTFWSNTTNSLSAYGGGGSGWLSRGSVGVGGSPLGGALGTSGGASTFGGGGGGTSATGTGGDSVYGGGGGAAASTGRGGNSIYGGGGGTATGTVGTSVFGGKGGNSSVLATTPGGGGGTKGTVTTALITEMNGARGEVRVWVIG